MKIEELLGFVFEAAKMAGAHTPAFQDIAKRIGEAVGGNDQVRLSNVLDEAVAARRKAGKDMQDAGKAR